MKKLLFALVLISCSEDEPVMRVPDHLYNYHVDRYYEELAKRGLDSIPYITIDVAFKELRATCTNGAPVISSSFSNGVIWITKDYSKGANGTIVANDRDFGAIVARELTHLLLGKPYTLSGPMSQCNATFEWTDQNLDELMSPQ